MDIFSIKLNEVVKENHICTILELYKNENKLGDAVVCINFELLRRLRSITKLIKPECILLSLNVITEFRNNGYGTILLKQVITYCRCLGIKQINLDDCSNNFNKPNNIYLKAGFRYIVEGFPEMVLDM